MDKYYNQNDNFTIFVAFKHDSEMNDLNDEGIGFRHNFGVHYPYLAISRNNIHLKKSSSSETIKSIPSNYRNKHLMIWFTKNGDRYEIQLCEKGGKISEIASGNFSSNRIVIDLDLYVQRVGLSPNHYAVNSVEHDKIMFLEKSKGTNFY